MDVVKRSISVGSAAESEQSSASARMGSAQLNLLPVRSSRFICLHVTQHCSKNYSEIVVHILVIQQIVMTLTEIQLSLYHSIFCPAFRAATGILPLYPRPSNQGHVLLRLCSNVWMDCAFCSVSAISSRPFNRQCLRNGSTVKGIGGFPFALRISCFSKSTSSSRPCSASSARAVHCSFGNATGSIPFCMVLLRKISAKLGAMMQRIPKSFLCNVIFSALRSNKANLVESLTDSKEHALESCHIQSWHRRIRESWLECMVPDSARNL